MDEMKNKTIDATRLNAGGDTEDQDQGGEKTVLSADKYPELQGIQPGAMVKGTWEGKVESNDNGQVTIAYSSLEIEGGANKADKELERITGKNGDGHGKKVSNQPAAEEGDEEDY